MSYQVLARKWRPKKFQDVIGQEHVTKSLQNAIAKNKIGHAYMMVGTRGVGKTSVARIFAKAIRCENITSDINACGTCKACLDFDTETSMNVIEIDGASNNSVDNIRDLISNVHYLPTTGRFKVYIIDEVHMLSTNAFNALLKTLEEPPSHVVFIFATTEAQKLLGTVLSRCQRFDLRNISVPRLVDYVKKIAVAENIKFENDDLIHQLAVLGRGSARDTLSLLDQVLTFSEDNNILEETFTTSLGVAGPKSIRKMISAIYAGDTEPVSRTYNKLLEENVSAKNIISSMLDEIYSDMKQTTLPADLSRAEVIWIYESMAKETSWIFDSITPEKALEVLFHKVALRRTFFNQKIVGATTSVATTSVATTQTTAPVASATPVAQTASVAEEPKVESVGDKLKSMMAEFAAEPKVETAQAAPVKVAEPLMSSAPEGEKDLSWEGFLNFLSTKSPASASNLEQGNILSPLRLEGGRLSIELGFNFSGMVFLEYLREESVFMKLLNNLSEYFSIDKKNIQLELKEVTSNENFISTAQLREEKEQISMKDRVEEFKSNPLLKEAEKIFNAKVDKVILENKK